MRDILEDAHAHSDAGQGRNDAADQRKLPKRFYKQVSVEPRDGGFGVLLDGRITKTPGRLETLVPAEALAEAMAAEWQAQAEVINPMKMPLVRLVNAGVEGGEKAAAALRSEVVKYAADDLMLFRADSPQELVAAQDEGWDPVLTALARHFSIRFQPVIGIIHQDQPQQTLNRLAESLEGTHHLAMAALVSATGLTGSGLLAIALKEKLIDADAAWTAAHVDEDYNIRLWGEDGEAAARRAARRIEFDAAVKVIKSLAVITSTDADRG